MKNKTTLVLLALFNMLLSIPSFAQQLNNYKNDFPTILPCGNKDSQEDILNKMPPPSSCFDVLTQGYGDVCENSDASIPALPFPTCGKFRVPIAFRKIAQDDCSGLVPNIDQRLDDELCYLNELFASLDIEFFECSRPAPICSSDYYSFDAQEDGDDDDNQIQAENIPGVINIYLANSVISDDGELIGGYAPLGGNFSNPRILVDIGQTGAFPSGASACGTTACGSSGQMYPTIAHEIGHFFGLRHTFNDNQAGEDLADNSLCCTMSDLTCDTEPDPIDIDNTGTSCFGTPPCTYNGTAVDSLGNTYSSYTTNNIMSYWSFSCLTEFTTFQNRRMYDALMYCNTYLCCDSPDAYLVDATQQQIDICKDEPLPAINAIADRCYNWYDGEDDTANLIASGTSALTAAQVATFVDNSQPGTYTMYIQDANSYQDPPCRVPIEIKVSAEAGNGSSNGASTVNINTCDSSQDIPLTTDALSLAEGCVIGWWITETNPISTGVTDDATLMSAVGGAAIGTPINNPVNNIIESTGGALATDLSLAVDCNALNADLNYYATPVVAKSIDAVSSTNCTESTTGFDITIGDDPGQAAISDIGFVDCAQDTDCPTFNLDITVAGYTGAPDALVLRIRQGGCPLPNVIGEIVAGNGTYTFTEADFPACYDFNEEGLCVLIYEFDANGAENATLSWDLDITYPGVPAVTFPSLNSYNDCMFGAPVEISCDCQAACNASTTIANNPTQVCAGTSMVDVCVDVVGDASEVTIDVDGIIATGAVGGSQVCAALALTPNSGCDALTQNYTVSATCTDGTEILPPTNSTITIYPILSTNIIDLGTSCMAQIDLVDAAGNICQSASRSCTANGEALNIDFGAPSSADNPITTQVNDPLGCSTLTASSTCICPPPSCENDPTTTQACDDGDDCTENDMETVLDANGMVCVPCTGTPVTDCACTGTVQTCDDGDDCTENDMETLASNGDVCVPCAGTPVTDCACKGTVQTCDDGDDCTENDMETLASNGDVCVPCIGTFNQSICTGCPDPTACNYSPDVTIDDGSCVFPGDPCNDGNPLTDNDIIQPDCSCGSGGAQPIPTTSEWGLIILALLLLNLGVLYIRQTKIRIEEA